MFQIHQKVLFKHCDPAGIVFYPRYFEMINDCIEAFFDHLGHPFENIHKTAAVPTVAIETRFTAPSRHGDHLALTLTVTNVGHSSLGLAVTATAQDQQRFACISTLVYVNNHGKPMSWPEDLRTALNDNIRSTT